MGWHVPSDVAFYRPKRLPRQGGRPLPCVVSEFVAILLAKRTTIMFDAPKPGVATNQGASALVRHAICFSTTCLRSDQRAFNVGGLTWARASRSVETNAGGFFALRCPVQVSPRETAPARGS